MTEQEARVWIPRLVLAFVFGLVVGWILLKHTGIVVWLR